MPLFHSFQCVFSLLEKEAAGSSLFLTKERLQTARQTENAGSTQKGLNCLMDSGPANKLEKVLSVGTETKGQTSGFKK